MAKAIKFNLICDQKPVRTIEDLQNNFPVEDMLDYYHSKVLHRWLSVRGYDTELEKVSAITSNDPLGIIKELIRIFNVPADPKEAEESIYVLKYLNERKELCALREKENHEAKNITKDIIDAYEAGYRQLVDGIRKNPKDATIIKKNIAEMISKYSWIFELNHRDLFWDLREHSALAIMCLLMNNEARRYYLPTSMEFFDIGNIFSVFLESSKKNVDAKSIKKTDKKEMFDSICELIKGPDFILSLRDNLITFCGENDSRWENVEPKGKRYMIISIGDGDYVRPAGSNQKLSRDDILNKFVVIDGIDYKNTSDFNSHKLLYLEV